MTQSAPLFTSPFKSPQLDWARECFSVDLKDQEKLLAVYIAATEKLREYEEVGGGKVGLTSFRRGGPNEKHGLLHIIDKILRSKFKLPYVHYQSGHENTLFGFGPSSEAFAIETSAGNRACKTEAETTKYTDLEMRIYWYIEWLAVLHFIAMKGGVLIMFDLAGKAAMQSSPNCAMELALLYQLFGEDIDDTAEMRNRIKLVVLDDDDIVDMTEDSLAAIVEKRVKEGQDEQKRKFEEAYSKCAPVLEEAGATKYLGRWIRDFVQVVDKVEGLVDERGRRQMSRVAYLQSAFHRLLNDAQLQEYFEDRQDLKQLNISYNNKITKLPNLPSTLEQLSCGYNKIQKLPDLPPTLVYLNCGRNEIQKLPDLPPTLEKLICDSNRIKQLPDLPSTLEYLNCGNNKIELTAQQKADIQAQAPNCKIYW